MLLSDAEVDRFWAKVERTETCWLWTAGKFRRGYGKFWLHGRSQRAPRVAWRIARAFVEIPDGLWVLHECDTPACVRPDHLFLGTASDNAVDAFQKGRRRMPRGPRGAQHGRARLAEVDILAIRDAHAGGETQTSIAKRFDTTQARIFEIVSRKTWRHI